MNYLAPLKNKESLKTINIILEKTNDNEKEQLLSLVDNLIYIRELNISRRNKIKETLKLFKKSKAATPLLKNLKALVWDNRSIWIKLGVGVTAGVAVMTPGNAGIAALGTAVGVPLWVVVGGGYSFALLLADKLRSALKQTKKSDVVDATYTVID